MRVRALQAAALDAGTQVGGDPQLDVDALAGGDDLAVPVALVGPVRLDAGRSRRPARTSCDRSTVPLTHSDRAQQAVLGVEVGRRATVRLGALRRGCATDPCTGRRARCSQPVRVCQVVSTIRLPGRYRRAAGTISSYGPSRNEPALRSRMALKTRRRVGPRDAHPLDRAARSDQAVGLAVGEERVVGDRRERALSGRLAGRRAGELECRDVFGHS